VLFAHLLHLHKQINVTIINKYNRIKETLELLNIRLENIDDAVNQLQEQVNQLEAEKTMVENSFDSLIERYTIAKTERIYTQVSLEEKVDEFAELNYLLDEQLRTLEGQNRLGDLRR
jgi:chromosome segregation ATPase